MAYRRHITAVQNTSPDAVTGALSSLGITEVNEVINWCWVMTSVWTTGTQELLDALVEFEGPVLHTTTEDGCRWRLYLRKKGLPPYATVHEFGWIGEEVESASTSTEEDWDDVYGDNEQNNMMVEVFESPPIPETTLTPLDFEDDFFEPYEDDLDDEDETQSPLDLLLEDFTDYDMQVPDEIVEALCDVPAQKLYSKFLELHARHIADKLAEYGIAHDPTEVIRMLQGEGVTAAEMQSDVGNLWRFLEHLGLGSDFREALDDFESSDEEYEEEEYDPVAYITEKTDSLPMASIVDGPVAVPLTDAPLLYRAINCQDIQLRAAFLVPGDVDEEIWLEDSIPAYAEIQSSEGRTALWMCGGEVLLAPKARARVGAVLAKSPDLVPLELIAEGSYNTALRMTGVVRQGSWHINELSAPLSKEALLGMLELFRTAEAREPIAALNEEEADAVMDDATRHMMLFDNMPKRDGLTLKCESRAGAESLCSLFFLRRYSDVWDFTKYRKETRKNYEDWRKLQQEVDEQEQLPVMDEVILEGKASRFFGPDFEAPSMDRALRVKAQRVRGLDRKFGELGFQTLGDLICEKVGICVLRGYVNEAEQTYAVHYTMAYGTTWCEFFTRCADGTTLTTTGGINDGSIRALRILFVERLNAKLPDLHGAHREGLSKLGERGYTPAEVKPTLQVFASEIDAFLLRRIGYDEGALE